MRRIAAFIAVLLVGVSAIYFTERRHDATPVSANAVVQVAADAQRDLTRLPLRLTRLSDEQEIAIGNELARQYSVDHENLSPEDIALDAYVRRVGSILDANAHRHLPYSFHLLPTHAVMNAFSLPGGHVYIGAGLLDLMTSEDEMASVLGHEIEHVDHYHCAERVQVEAQMRNLKLGIVGALVQIPLSVWEAGYNKDEELEADREGTRLAVLAGYSPYGSVNLFERMAELQKEYIIHAQTPEEELSELAIQSLEGYFRSHPQPSERLAQAKALIAQEGWQNRKVQKPFRVEYEVHNGQYVK
jgi:predicted Zn-dependent protease